MSSQPPSTLLPSRQDLIAFIAKEGGEVGTREIARAFGLKNADRAALKQMLRELEDDGAIEKRRKKLHRPGMLPNVVLADITGRDSDGELIAVPAEWDEEAQRRCAENPHSRAAPCPSRAKCPASATARCCGSRKPATPRTASATRAASSRSSIAPSTACSASSASCPAAADGWSRSTRNISAANWRSPPTLPAMPQDGDLVAVEVARPGRLGLPTGRCVERLGSLASENAVSLIAIHAHGIPHVFSPAVLRRGRGGTAGTLDGREDWREVPFVTIDPPDAKDHDDAVFARPDTDPNNAGGFVIDVAIADVAHYVTPGSALDREALDRGNSVYFPDRVVPMLPERISNDLAR